MTCLSYIYGPIWLTDIFATSEKNIVEQMVLCMVVSILPTLYKHLKWSIYNFTFMLML